MNGPGIWLRAARANQWTKNAVVFAAWAFAFADASQAQSARGWLPFLYVCAMAASFSLVSSSFYLLNDVSDCEADMLHPVKRKRPVASGAITKIDAVRAALMLYALGQTFPCWLVMHHPERTWGFAVLMAYSIVQCAYSAFLKRVPYVDVAVIAAGFVMRASAGAAAISARISPWLLGCTFLLSLFLALCKRRHERLISLESRSALAGYHPKALDGLIVFSALATCGAYACYTLSADTVARFGTRWLAATVAFVALGLGRYLQLTYSRRDVGRPEKVLLTDRALWLIMLGYAAAACAVFVFRGGGGE